MDATSKLIAEEINSGQYFIEARKWYNDIFLKPASGAAFMCAASLVVLAIFIFSMYSVSRIYPLSRQVDVVVFLKNTVDFYPKLKPLPDKNKPLKQAVVEYLGSRYIQAREDYGSKRFSAHYHFVLHSSAKRVFDKYYSAINNTIAALRKDGEKSDIQIISKSSDENSITVNFRKKVYNIKGKLLSNSTWKAKMKYHLSDYDFTKSTDAKINFIVTQYDLEKIK
jgi:type IV secretion system protein VirB8